MTLQFIHYPKCSTCQQAKAWLEEHNISFNSRDIVKETPSSDELMSFIRKTDKPLKSFFNTSGLVYKNLNLKEKIPLLSKKEQIELLASNGMLIKRPLIIGTDFILIGFKASEWEKKLK